MTHYLCIASLSPVQASIEQGVKPRDFWAGSFLINLQMAMYLWAIRQEGKVPSISIISPYLDKDFCGYDSLNFQIKDIWGSLTHNTKFVISAEDDKQAKEILQSIYSRFENQWKEFLIEWVNFVPNVWEKDSEPMLENDKIVSQIMNYYQLVYTAVPLRSEEITNWDTKSEMNYQNIDKSAHNRVKEAHNDRKSWNLRKADIANPLGKACHMIEGLSALCLYDRYTDSSIYLSGVGLLKRTVGDFLWSMFGKSKFIDLEFKNNFDDIKNIIHIDIDGDDKEKNNDSPKCLIGFSKHYKENDTSNVLLSTVMMDGDKMKDYFSDETSSNGNKSEKLWKFSRDLIRDIRNGFYDASSPFYGFYLIYAGGDDVYGLSVSANKSTYVHSEFKSEKNKISHYINDVVFEINQRFGKKLKNENESDDSRIPHMSAGIIHHATNAPLRMTYHLSHDALKSAKEDFGRNKQLDQLYASGRIIKSYAFGHTEWLNTLKEMHATEIPNGLFYDLFQFIQLKKSECAREANKNLNDLNVAEYQSIYSLYSNEMNYLFQRKVNLCGINDQNLIQSIKTIIENIPNYEKLRDNITNQSQNLYSEIQQNNINNILNILQNYISNCEDMSKLRIMDYFSSEMFDTVKEIKKINKLKPSLITQNVNELKHLVQKFEYLCKHPLCKNIQNAENQLQWIPFRKGRIA